MPNHCFCHHWQTRWIWFENILALLN